MGGPTNTQPRYRPPPPGMAPPPPPPAHNDGGAPLGGHAPTHQQQQQYHQQPQQSYYAQQQQQQPPQQSYYAPQQHQPQQPQQSYYAQQQQQPSQQPSQHQQPQQPQPAPSRTSIPGSNQSYASRSVAAHSPHGSQHSGPTPPTTSANTNTMTTSNHSTSNHSNNSHQNNNPPNTTNTTTKPTPTTSRTPDYNNPTHHLLAEQSLLLTNATKSLTESAHQMHLAMESNNVCTTLEKACLLLEELGDPNHGVHHRGGTGNRGGGGGVVNGIGPGGGSGIPSYNNYSGAGGAVPPLGNYPNAYGDNAYGRHNGQQHHGHGHHHTALVTPLSPKNYYELHMRAMDEMPSLEEYLLGLCHVPNIGAGMSSSTNTGMSGGGPTNYTLANNGAMNHAHYQGSVAPIYPPALLYETVQYCPRVVPRLYLQITMGAVSIRAGSSNAVDVMNELGEASKCVQCPVRGLFLRYYLLCALKDKLPDGSLEEEEEEGSDYEEEENGVEIMGEEDLLLDGDGGVMLSPLSPVAAKEEHGGQEILGASEPTSPPPALPPPPPPAAASLAGLFPESTAASTSNSLFGDEETGAAPTSNSLFGDSPTGAAAKGDSLFGDSTGAAAKGDSLFGDSPTQAPSSAKKHSDLFAPSGDGGGDLLFADEPINEEPKETTAAVAVPAPADAPPKSPTPTKKKKKKKKPSPASKQPADPNGTVTDSYNFILSNLIEMNRLWIRIQHLPGPNTKENRKKRDKERNDLRILVGSNLNRLSQLEGVSAHIYGSQILPRILDEVATCRDPLSQAYLMDCIIQVFPDEFHLETLEVFLGVCPKLREKVNVRTILTNMMERLLSYYGEANFSNDEEDTNNVKYTMAMHSFDMFEDCVERYFEARGMSIPPKDVIRLQGCLLNYALKISPGNVVLIKRCISTCAKGLGTLQEVKRSSMQGQGIVLGGGTKKSMEIDMCNIATTELEKLLSVPLEGMKLQNVLEMSEFSMLLTFLPWENRRKVAVSMVKSVIGGGEGGGVKNANELEQLLTILSPLLRDEGMAAPSAIYDGNDYGASAASGGSLISRTANLMGTLGISPSADHDDLFGGPNTMSGFPSAQSFGGDQAKIAQFREEQTLIAKLIHVLQHEDSDITYQMLNVARRHVQSGGVARVTVTLPAIVFEALALLRKVQGLEFADPVVVPKAKKEPGNKEEPNAVEEETNEESKEAANEGFIGTVDAEAKDEAKDEKDGEKAATKTEEAATTTDTTEDELEKKDSGKDSPDSTVEEAKEEKTETPMEEAATDENDEKPTLHFPEFTKSVNCRKVLVFLQKTVAMLAPNNPELAFKLYLEIAVSTDLLALATQKHHSNSSAEFTSIAYDFMTQAFLVYEDEISESNAQIRAITAIVGSLLSSKTYDKTDYEALITKTAQYAAKLLKKPDQCRMVCLCSRLFYVGGKENTNTNAYRNPQRVLECLQRGLKIADAIGNMGSNSNVQLFVEILDYYVYYFEIGNPVITDKFVSGLIALINEHFDSIALPSAAIVETRAYYDQILDQIRRKKTKEAKFGMIVC